MNITNDESDYYSESNSASSSESNSESENDYNISHYPQLSHISQLSQIPQLSHISQLSQLSNIVSNASEILIHKRSRSKSNNKIKNLCQMCHKHKSSSSCMNCSFKFCSKCIEEFGPINNECPKCHSSNSLKVKKNVESFVDHLKKQFPNNCRSHHVIQI